MPPSGFTKKAVGGALVFIKTCYEDLLDEVQNGKHDSYEVAIEYEIGQIEKALKGLHITGEGEVEIN